MKQNDMKQKIIEIETNCSNELKSGTTNQIKNKLNKQIDFYHKF